MNEAAEEEASPVAEEDAQRAPGNGTRLRGTIMLAAAALVMAAAAVALAANATAFERWLTGLFGPPRVELKEAYGAAGAESNASEASFDHSALDALLRQYVDADGWVDYAGLQADQARLDAYLAAVADAPFDALGRDEKLALLINAYNAFTLKLIVEHLPKKGSGTVVRSTLRAVPATVPAPFLPIGSIMDIPAAERWDAERWNVGGNVWSLNQIEHEQIRPKFVEPRIHFALVCAAVGCPPLRNEAYDPSCLDEQLAAQSEYVHRHATWFHFDSRSNVLRLTRLYDWYGDDFVQVAGSTAAFAARYSPELKQALEGDVPPKIEWLPYDWKLNDLPNKQAR
jgi:hypothetical protein